MAGGVSGAWIVEEQSFPCGQPGAPTVSERDESDAKMATTDSV